MSTLRCHGLAWHGMHTDACVTCNKPLEGPLWKKVLGLMVPGQACYSLKHPSYGP